MRSAKQGSAERRLEQLQSRIVEWRRTRARHSRMPAEFWDEATALGHEFGVSVVQFALGINHDALRRRLESEVDAAGSESAGFVELQRTTRPAETTGSILELEDANGWRLTLRLACGTGVDVARVISAFRGTR